MFEWIRSRAGTRSSPRNRTPNPDTSRVTYPEDVGSHPDSVGTAEFAPGAFRQREQRPIIRAKMPLTELVEAYERLSGEFIEQVKYVHHMHADLGELRQQIGMHIASRDEEIEAEHVRNEELRKRIGAKDDQPAKVEAREPNVAPAGSSELLSSTSLTVPTRQGGDRGVRQLTPSSFRTPRRPPTLPSGAEDTEVLVRTQQ